MREEELLNFISSPCRNKWLEVGPVKVYVRKSYRQAQPCLDLASIEIKYLHRRQGHFKQTLSLFQKHSSHVYIENVLNPDLRRYLDSLVAGDPCWHEAHQVDYCYRWLSTGDINK